MEKYIFIVTWQLTGTGQPSADVGQKFCVRRYEYQHAMHRQRANLGLADHQITDDFVDMNSQPGAGRK